MDEELLFKKLSKRINAKPDDIKRIIAIVNKYNLSLNIRNFDSNGLILFDENNQTVRICFDGIKDQTLIKLKDPKTKIAVVYSNGLLAGWIESDALENAGDVMLIDAESLHKMPSEFSFKQECPHLDIYGGFTSNGNGWQCAGCKEKLVFNDS